MTGIYESQAFWPNIATFFISFILSTAIAMAGWCGRLIVFVPANQRAVQNFHLGQTPRLGGASIIIATTVSAIFFFPDEFWTGYIFVLICCFPALALAMLEDTGFDVAPVLRLGACFLSSAIYLKITGDILPTVGIEIFDQFLLWPAIGFVISILFVTAAVQAMNLIDGLNGLCSGIGFLIYICFAIVAQAAENSNLFYISTAGAIAILGFFVVNYPGGSIFLGDSGAYWLGFSLSLFAIHFLREVPDFSAPAMLLIFFWPAFDIFLAIWRRLFLGRHLFRPDRMHPHHIAVRTLRARLVGAGGRPVANSLAASLILLLAAPPMALGVAFWNDRAAAWSVLLFCVVAYPAFYLFAVRAARRDIMKSAAHRKRIVGADKSNADYAALGWRAASRVQVEAGIVPVTSVVGTGRPAAIAATNGISSAETKMANPLVVSKSSNNS